MAFSVLHVCPFQGFFGANRSMLTLIEELSRRGVRQGLFLIRQGDLEGIAREYGVETTVAHTAQSLPRFKLFKGIGSAIAIRQMVAAFHPSLIHSSSAMGMRYAWAAALGRRLPIVCHQRDNYAANYFHLGLARANRVIAISNHVRSQLPYRLQARTTVVYNAVGMPSPADAVAVRAPGPLRLAAAGRATLDKGFDILIEAAKRLNTRFDFEVHLWGVDPLAAGGYGAELRRHVEAAAGRGLKIFQQPFRKDIDTLYRMADIVVVPSRYPEPFGRMAIEAMAWGKTVVVAGHGGLAEIVRNEWNGLTHVPGDAGDLARQIERLLTDELLAATLAENAKTDAVARFSPGAHADAVMTVYEETLARMRR
jgi:glycosyltransferase involved in cell wall biosynthesis